MGLTQLNYFVAVAEHKGISAASAHIHIAQPALSAQIAKLEEELGVKLFVRHRRGVFLSEAGEIFLEHAYKVLEQINRARHAVLHESSEPNGEVTFGLPVSTSTILTVPIVEQVRDKFPGIKLHVVDGMSGDVFRWLVDGQLDAAILYGDECASSIAVKHIVSDELYLIGKQNKLTRGRSEIAFRDLAQFPLLHNSATRSRLRLQLDNTARRLNCPLNFSNEIDSIPQLKALIYRGYGYSILPKISLSDEDIPADLCMLRLTRPALRLNSYLAVSPHKSPSRATICVFEFVDKLVASLIGDHTWPGGHSITSKQTSDDIVDQCVAN